MIDQKTLIAELESLAAQRAAKLEDLHRIDGAEKMVRHLLAKGQRAGEKAAERNGLPAEGEPVVN